MLIQAHDFSTVNDVLPPHSALLRECLAFTPTLKARLEPAPAEAFDGQAREIERLKMYRPGEAAERAERWLRQTLHQARQSFDHGPGIRRFCSALSTWGAVQRHLGQASDAAHAQLHALEILRPQPCSTLTGFVLQRLAHVLGDLGGPAAGLISAHQAVAVHELTVGGERNVAIATAGLAAFQLFYRRAFEPARAAYLRALDVGLGDDIFTVSARHGLAYSYLMQGRTAEARERLEALRGFRLEPDQALRLDWMAAELDAADGQVDEALERYAELFDRATSILEASGAILLAIDAAALLIGRASDSAHWYRPLRPIVEKLSRAQHVALEPFIDALAAGELDRELLDQTAVAFKKANHRMLLGMGRPQGAGRPDLMGRLAA